jgi:hypothetical protein
MEQFKVRQELKRIGPGNLEKALNNVDPESFDRVKSVSNVFEECVKRASTYDEN